MGHQSTFENKKLATAEKFLCDNMETFEERICFLEKSAAIKSGANIDYYWKQQHIPGIKVSDEKIRQFILTVENSGIPFPIAISSLARKPLTVEQQKKDGVFYTDFRLANLIADSCAKDIKQNASIVDFAAGTCILLIGIALKYKNSFSEQYDEWLKKNVFAFDLSEDALRGGAAAFLSTTNNAEAIVSMIRKWKVCDSLLDADVSKMKFDIVVGNPPWGRIKLTRHNFATRAGYECVYGADYPAFNNEQFLEEKDYITNYSKVIKEKFNFSSNSEPDFYMAFLQKAIQSAKKQCAKIAFLVPAGLIRSQGTYDLRKQILNSFSKIEFDLLDNKGNFFSIDSRFKFLLLLIEIDKKKKTDHFLFNILCSKNNSILRGNDITFQTKELEKYRPDLTIPEVRNKDELKLFFKICDNGKKWGNVNNEWEADISREVDMTSDKDNFISKQAKNSFPVIEGRMVQQYRFGAKTYLSGQGRSAVWKPCCEQSRSQFFIEQSSLSDALKERVKKFRVGFCDIAGQTNERSMMSAVIPPNVICGNKVPTLLFPKSTTKDILYLWQGITNSFVFDWMIRRVVSTTINYFLLFSIPLPNIKETSPISKKIISKSRQLSMMGKDFYDGSKMPQLRAEIDVLVAQAYGLDLDDLKLILSDFPLLDKKQRPIANEKKSSITTDLLLSMAAKEWKLDCNIFDKRLKQQKNSNAYIPSEMTVLCQKEA